MRYSQIRPPWELHSCRHSIAQPLARSSATIEFTAQTLASRTISCVECSSPSESSACTRRKRSERPSRAACIRVALLLIFEALAAARSIPSSLSYSRPPTRCVSANQQHAYQRLNDAQRDTNHCTGHQEKVFHREPEQEYAGDDNAIAHHAASFPVVSARCPLRHTTRDQDRWRWPPNSPRIVVTTRATNPQIGQGTILLTAAPPRRPRLRAGDPPRSPRSRPRPSSRSSPRRSRKRGLTRPAEDPYRRRGRSRRLLAIRRGRGARDVPRPLKLRGPVVGEPSKDAVVGAYCAAISFNEALKESAIVQCTIADGAQR